MESKRGSGFLIGRAFLTRTVSTPHQVRGRLSLENALEKEWIVGGLHDAYIVAVKTPPRRRAAVAVTRPI
jgi:hypothetical protein